ncbi:MAG: hypothetical protein U9P79_05215 [Candidatus Cloacimonadota bacterium]|nr:hypothetical protein [Candidatus Cloacimonadota bacterium]
MKKIAEMDVKELGAFVSTHLKKCGIEVTLTGGSCVSIYSENRYVSMDLDFIEDYYIKRTDLIECLSKINFYEENRYFKHKDTDLIVEFPAGPLSVGEEPIKDIITLHTDTGDLKIISPTECVKDRLSAYYFWNDMQCFEQALLVAKFNEINFNEVKRWSRNEDEEEKYKIFINTFKNGEWEREK